MPSQAPQRLSINLRLTLIIVSCLVLTTFLALLQGYETSFEEAQKQLDQQLHSVSKVLINTPVEFWPEQNELFAKLWKNNDVQFTAELLANVNRDSLPENGFSTVNIAGKRLRVFVLSHNYKTLMLAEPVSIRFALIESLIIAAMTPLVMVMPLLAIAIAWYVRKSLLPLTDLSKELQYRRANDFNQLTTSSEDAEIAPVIERLNSLFTKVEAAYLRERYFASDAAHELKTPISGLKIHLHNLQQGKVDSLDALEQGIAQLNHIVEQMLTLARTEPDSWKSQFYSVDLLAFTQSLVAEHYDKIDSKAQQISLIGESLSIIGCQFTLATLLGNLLTNAIKYTPKQGEIRLTLIDDENKVGWRIEDSGPGMTEAQIGRVFDRFYRVGGDKHPSGEKGAGLGMAIVQQLIAIYHAHIELARAELGGLMVTVWFNKETN